MSLVHPAGVQTQTGLLGPNTDNRVELIITERREVKVFTGPNLLFIQVGLLFCWLDLYGRHEPSWFVQRTVTTFVRRAQETPTFRGKTYTSLPSCEPPSSPSPSCLRLLWTLSLRRLSLPPTSSGRESPGSAVGRGDKRVFSHLSRSRLSLLPVHVTNNESLRCPKWPDQPYLYLLRTPTLFMEFRRFNFLKFE